MPDDPFVAKFAPQESFKRTDRQKVLRSPSIKRAASFQTGRSFPPVRCQ